MSYINKHVKKNTNDYKILYAVLSYFIPFAIFMLAMALLQITPFGDNTLLFADANGIYVNVYSYLRKILSGEHSFLYSFSLGLGNNLMGLTGYYYLNPFVFLYAFSTTYSLPTFYTIITALMIGSAGLTFYLFAIEAFGRRRAWLIFSTSYALMAYMITYCWQQQWLFVIILFPLVILGCVRIIRGKSSALLLITFTLSVLSNFYIGYMSAMAAVFLFLGMLAQKKSGCKPVLIRFLFTCVLGGLIASIVWLPTLMAIKDGRLQQSSIEDFSFDRDFSLLSFLSKFFTGSTSVSQIISGLPNVFCGILVVFLVILFFANGRIEKRKRITYGILLGIYFISLYLKPLASIFQGFSQTNWFPYRYSYVFSFLLICAAMEEMIVFKQEQKSHIRNTAIGMAIATILVFSFTYEYVSTSSIVIDVTLTVLFCFAYWFYSVHPERAPYRVLIMFLGMCMCFDLYFNIYLTIHKQQSSSWNVTVSDFQQDVDELEPIISQIQISDPEFYRLEKTWKRTNNDPMLFDYNGVGHGSSSWGYQIQIFEAKLGLMRMQHYVAYSSGIDTSVDDLLGIKYLLSKEDMTERKQYTLLGKIGDIGLYRNENALPLAFLSKNSLNDIDFDEENVFTIKNDLWKKITGENQNIFTMETNVSFTSHNEGDSITMDSEEVESRYTANSNGMSNDNENEDIADISVTTSSAEDTFTASNTETGYYVEYSFTAAQDGPIYMYYYDPESIATNGSSADLQRYLGYYKKGDTVTDKVYLSDVITEDDMEEICHDIYIAYENTDLLTSYVQEIKEKSTSLNKISDIKLSGTFEADTDETLLFTFAYDEGWTLTIDGQKVETKMAANALLATDVKAGSHTFTLTYWPTGLTVGIVICIVALAGSALYLILESRKLRK